MTVIKTINANEDNTAYNPEQITGTDLRSGKRGLDVAVNPANYVDDGLNKIGLLNAGTIFTTDAIEVSKFSQVDFNMWADKDGPDNGIFVERSHDGTTWRTYKSYTYKANTDRNFQYGRIANFLRFTFTAHPTEDTNIEFFTVVGANQSLTTQHRLDGQLTEDRTASLNISALTGQTVTGGFKRATMTNAGRLNVDDGSLKSISGTSIIETPIPHFEAVFARDSFDNKLVFTSNISNPISQANGKVLISTSTGANDETEAWSRQNLPYSSNRQSEFDFTAVFPVASGNRIVDVGIMDKARENGVVIRRIGSAISIVRKTGGVEESPITVFNGDPLDGSKNSNFTRNSIPEPIDWEKGNIFRIRLLWFGFSVITIEAQSPDVLERGYVPIHTILYPNTSTDPHLEDPDLSLYYRINNNGETTAASIGTASFRGASMSHPRPQSPIIFQRTSETDGILPTGATPTIDTILNTEGNVFDSGWIPTSYFPSGNFVNIVGNKSLRVYLLNASNKDGSNMVGNTSPAIITSPFVPAPFSAPYFDEFYRIVVVNESGEDLTDYTIFNRGHESPIAPLQLGIEQTLLSFFSATLGRNILAAKDDTGIYDNIGRSGDALRNSLKEHEVATPILSLDGFETNGVGSVGVTPIQIASSRPVDSKSISIKANPGNSKVLYIGNNSAVGLISGYPLAAGDSVEIDIDETPSIWIRSASGTNTVHWLVGKGADISN